MLVNIFAGIIQLILYMRQVPTLAAHNVWVALCADTQNDVFGLDRFSIRQCDREIAFFTCQCFRFRAITHIDAGVTRSADSRFPKETRGYRL